MHTRGFDSDARLKTHRVGSDTRALTYDAAPAASRKRPARKRIVAVKPCARTVLESSGFY
jgi:hypothetical protein